MDLALLYEALDVPEDNGPGFLLHIARQKHFTLPHLILSVLARDGEVPMSEAAKAELARAWRRSEHYEAVVARFPQGAKAPDALLRLAMIQKKRGANDKARELINRLQSDFPQSDAARRAPKE